MDIHEQESGRVTIWSRPDELRDARPFSFVPGSK